LEQSAQFEEPFV